MTPAADPTEAEFGSWHPGIESQPPSHLRHLSTIFRDENVFTSVAKAEELRDLTGLELSELVAFRPQRLALHEVLVRVTADFSVPDGSKIEDLGINFRQITRGILAGYVEPAASTIETAYAALRRELSGLIGAELARLLSAPTPSATVPPRPRTSGLLGLLVHSSAPEPLAVRDSNREINLIAQWDAAAHSARDGLHRAAYRALARVVSALLVRHGRAWGGRELIAAVATDLACNDHGSEEIGRFLEPSLAMAAERERYRLLPPQEHPLVMNTKGASASGKSTLRPLQKRLAGDIGVNWSDFALISPDIWRKQLLDYETLGAAYKYAGMFTGEELQIVDHKLDRYMARKAERGAMSHLLIDRFRFDSFAPDSDEAGSNLLTRFGHTIYLFFMITPPALLVDRAWNRGLEFGRYKAVDDTLAHCVEAYSGMPQLFFTWIARTDKRVHFEFLDNSVPQGERPRTVAFGRNDVLNVLDMNCLLDVERYRRVSIHALAPEFLYADKELLAPEKNTGFLRECVGRFPQINFAVQATGRVYLRIGARVPICVDREALEQVMADADTRAGLVATVPHALGGGVPGMDRPTYLSDLMGSEKIHTLGAWGGSRRDAFHS